MSGSVKGKLVEGKLVKVKGKLIEAEL